MCIYHTKIGKKTVKMHTIAHHIKGYSALCVLRNIKERYDILLVVARSHETILIGIVQKQIGG